MAIFQPSRKESAHLRKMIKGKNMGLKKWNLEALEDEKPKVNSLRPSKTGRSAGSFEEGTSKEGNSDE